MQKAFIKSCLLMTRLHCVFGDCICFCYIGTTQLCRRCNHGECWHKLENAFVTPRACAQRPEYVYESVPHSVPVAIAEEIIFCPTIMALPV